jgi:hypothetical protein
MMPAISSNLDPKRLFARFAGLRFRLRIVALLQGVFASHQFLPAYCTGSRGFFNETPSGGRRRKDFSESEIGLRTWWNSRRRLVSLFISKNTDQSVIHWAGDCQRDFLAT